MKRYRVESVAVPGLVFGEDLSLGSECVRGGKPVDGYAPPAFLEPGMATLQVYVLAGLAREEREVPGELDGNGFPKKERVEVAAERRAVFAVRRMADDPAGDADLQMATTPMTDAVRAIMGPGWVAPHRAAPPPPLAPPSGGRRRRSQVGASS